MKASGKIPHGSTTPAYLRPRDLSARGIARQYLRLAEQQRLVVRSGRGLYTPAVFRFSRALRWKIAVFVAIFSSA
jgi:hypothetical protein